MAETSSGFLKPRPTSASSVRGSSASWGKCEPQALALAGIFKQTGVVALDPAHMTEQCGGEGVASGKTEEPGEALERRRVGGEHVGLLVGDHLQAVLDLAQETISVGEVARGLRADPAAAGERREHRQGLAPAQLGMAAAGDELLGLDEKLDLADAAAAELDVVAFDRDLVMAAIGVHLPLHGVHVGDRRVVEILAPDERDELLEQTFAHGAVAGGDA